MKHKVVLLVVIIILIVIITIWMMGWRSACIKGPLNRPPVTGAIRKNVMNFASQTLPTSAYLLYSNFMATYDKEYAVQVGYRLKTLESKLSWILVSRAPEINISNWMRLYGTFFPSAPTFVIPSLPTDKVLSAISMNFTEDTYVESHVETLTLSFFDRENNYMTDYELNMDGTLTPIETSIYMDWKAGPSKIISEGARYGYESGNVSQLMDVLRGLDGNTNYISLETYQESLGVGAVNPDIKMARSYLSAFFPNYAGSNDDMIRGMSEFKIYFADLKNSQIASETRFFLQ
jgi:hypothetical protein